jgi:5-oxoprolinase (ATP-hydrolysing)
VPDYFPKIFGPNEDQPLDVKATRGQFEELANGISAFVSNDKEISLDEIAFGYVLETHANDVR